MGLLPVVAYAQSLEEAVQQTLLTNPNIQTSKFNLQAASALRRQAFAGFLPSVDVVLARGLEESDNTTTRATELVNQRFDHGRSNMVSIVVKPWRSNMALIVIEPSVATIETMVECSINHGRPNMVLIVVIKPW